MTEPETAAAETQAGLETWMRLVRRDARRAVEHPSEKLIHRVRTSLRRCRSIADVHMALDGDAAWPAMRRAARRLFRPLGRLRDLHVRQAWMLHLAPADDPTTARYLESQAAHEAELAGAARQALERFDLRRWRRWKRRLARRAERIPLGHPLLAQLAARQCGLASELHRRAMRNRSRVSWHNLRIAVKRFRYTVENFLPERNAAWGGALRRMQEVLGDIHDLDLLWEELAREKALFLPAQLAEWKERIDREVAGRIRDYKRETAGRDGLWSRLVEDFGASPERLATPEECLAAWGELWGVSPGEAGAGPACQLLEGLSAEGVLEGMEPETSRRVLAAAAWMAAVEPRLGRGGSRRRYFWMRELGPPLGLPAEPRRTVALVVRFLRPSRPDYLLDDLKALGEEERRNVERLAGILQLSSRLLERLNGGLKGIVVEPGCDESIVVAACLDDPALAFGPALREEKSSLEAVCGRPVVLYPYLTTQPQTR